MTIDVIVDYNAMCSKRKQCSGQLTLHHYDTEEAVNAVKYIYQ